MGLTFCPTVTEHPHDGVIMTAPLNPAPQLEEDKIRADINDMIKERRRLYTPRGLTKSQQEYLFWSYRLGNLSDKKLKSLAVKGKIPRRLAKCDPSKSPACIFVKQNKKG